MFKILDANKPVFLDIKVVFNQKKHRKKEPDFYDTQKYKFGESIEEFLKVWPKNGG